MPDFLGFFSVKIRNRVATQDPGLATDPRTWTKKCNEIVRIDEKGGPRGRVKFVSRGKYRSLYDGPRIVLNFDRFHGNFYLFPR